MIFKSFIIGVFLFFLGAVQANENALELVKGAADSVLAKVVANKEMLQKEPATIYKLVSKEVIPHFNFQKMTQTAMGKYWRRANAEQKKQIQDLFQQILVRTYGAALLNYSGQKIQYLPVRERSETRVTVQTRVAEAESAPEIPVDYRLEQTGQSWKVYDVVIDGVSLVSNYRTSFSGQIRRKGIDGLIKELIDNKQGNN